MGLSLLAPPALAQGELFGRIMQLAIEKAREDAAEKAPPVEAKPKKQPVYAEDAPQDDYSEVAQSSSSIGLLYDTDLPYNDYRSGMDDPALKGIRLGDCVQICEADGRCQAFTYNSKARVCFLKHDAATPTRFKGAVSGIKGGGGAAFVPATGDEPVEDDELSRALNRDEIFELQQALNGAGYDAGKPDGQLGKRSRAAVAQFLADNPGAGSGRIDLGLLLAVTGVPRAVTFAGDAYQHADDIARQLALVSLAAQPDLIASDAAAFNWLVADKRYAENKVVTETAARYDAANEIDRPAILAQFREAVLAEAMAFAPDPAALALKVKFEDDTSLGTFDPETGMNIDEPYGLLRDRKLEYSNAWLPTLVVGIVPGLPDTYSLPLADEAAASALIDRLRATSKDGEVRLIAYLTLSGFGKDANASGAGAGGPGDLPVTITLDRLVAVTVPGRNKDKMPGNEQLAVLVDSAPASGTPGDPVRIARTMKLPMLDGRVLLAADKASLPLVSGDRHDSPVPRYFNLAAIGLDPEIARNGLDDRMVTDLLRPIQRLRVFGDRDGSAYDLRNEFERRRAATTFSDQIVPELIASAPAFPIPVVVLKRAILGAYDFESSSFPIDYDGAQRAVLVPSQMPGLQPLESYSALPDSLPMSEADAEEMLRRVHSGNRPVVVLATYGQLVAEKSGDSFAVRFVAERSSLFRGTDLTEEIMPLEVANLLVRPEFDDTPRRGVSVAGSDQPWVARYNVPVLDGRPLFVPDDMPGYGGLPAVSALFAEAAQPGRFEQRNQTLSMAIDLGFDVGPYLAPHAREAFEKGDYFERTYTNWEGVDEFAREDTRKRFIAANRPALDALLPALPAEISVLRYASVVEYSPGRSAFPVGLADRRSITPHGSGTDAVELVGAIDAPAELPMPEAEARAFRERLRQLQSVNIDPVIFGDARVTAPAGTLVVIETYRLDALRMDDDEVEAMVSPLQRSLHPIADLGMHLADIAFPGWTPRVVAATGPVDPGKPQSRFDILGITLGMPLDEARKLLEARFEGRNATPLDVSTKQSGPECARLEDQLHGELAEVTDAAETQRIRDTYIDDFAAADCGVVDLTVLQVAFAYDVPQENGQNDRIVVFKASQAGDIVGAVAREVSSGMLDALSNGLVDKYGQTYYGDNDSYYRVWADDPSMAPLFNNGSSECTPVWPELVQIPAAYRSRNCGAFVRQLHTQVLLIDTRYTALENQRLADRVAAAEAAQPRPKLDF